MSKSAKVLKKLVVNQIKKNHPNFNALTKTQKKGIITDIWCQVYNNYDINNEPELSKQELLNMLTFIDLQINHISSYFIHLGI